MRLAKSLLIGLVLMLPAPAPAERDREWKFRVLLDGSPIGTQTFRLQREGDQTRVSIEASFDVKFLFVTAYSYRHRNEEIWNGNCLRSLSSNTDDNGDLFEVRAGEETGGFAVNVNGVRKALPPCPTSFAYWNPAALKASQLLNSQTGDYLPITLHELGADTVFVRGAATPARRVALRGDKLDIQLWYSKDDDWLALESLTSSGRRLRFDLE